MGIISTTYDQDFHAWAMKNAELLRQGRFSEIDAGHIAEELEAMGRGERRQLESRLEVLLAHLLKWRHQPGLRSHSWRYTIREQRRKVEKVLRDNPSLRPELDAVIAEAYPDAVLAAARETGLHDTAFPQDCPFAVAQVLGEDYWPD